MLRILETANNSCRLAYSFSEGYNYIPVYRINVLTPFMKLATELDQTRPLI